jgi:hypothetical protein
LEDVRKELQGKLKTATRFNGEYKARLAREFDREMSRFDERIKELLRFDQVQPSGAGNQPQPGSSPQERSDGRFK